MYIFLFSLKLPIWLMDVSYLVYKHFRFTYLSVIKFYLDSIGVKEHLLLIFRHLVFIFNWSMISKEQSEHILVCVAQ